jgi:hypothetical protein
MGIFRSSYEGVIHVGELHQNRVYWNQNTKFNTRIRIHIHFRLIICRARQTFKCCEMRLKVCGPLSVIGGAQKEGHDNCRRELFTLQTDSMNS